MSYTALYRKFRPQEFEDVKGQEHIVTTLKNQIKAESHRTCLFVLRYPGYRKDDSGKDFCKSSKL